MELDLSSTSLLQVQSIPALNTLTLLNASKKGRQKIAVGDSSSSVYCYEIKRGSPVSIFKHKSRSNKNSVTSSKGIYALALGGEKHKKDKLFASTGRSVIGINKKGKNFFELSSNLEESIENLHVEETTIWTGCEYIYNRYDDGNDVEFFQCPDKVNALEYNYFSRKDEYDALLGCQDRCIRIVAAGKLVNQIAVSGSVTSVGCYDRSSTDDLKKCVFGTKNGSVSMIRIGADGASAGWTATIPEGKQKGKSSINCIDFYDISKDGVDDIIVGDDDGNVRVFGFDMNPDVPTMQFNKCIEESVSSVKCGCVNSPDYDEIVVAGFSGKLLSYTNEPLNTKDANDDYGRTHATINNENQIRSMTKDLDEMEKQLAKKKEQCSKREGRDGLGMVAPTFEAKCDFSLDEEEGAYLINIEIPLNINNVLLTSSVHVDLLDVDGNSATVSKSPPDVANNNMLLACYRLQDPNSRLQMKVRTNEGEYGELKATVVAETKPKSAVVVTFPVKPLSLHCRALTLKQEEQERLMNTLTLKGSFKRNVAHDWITASLPDIPPYQEDEKEEGKKICFRNVFSGSLLKIEYRTDLIVVESDNISTLAIFKEVVSRESTKRRIYVSDSVEVKNETIPGFLHLLHARLQHLLALSRQVEILASLEELNSSESEEATWLSPEYKLVLKNADQIRLEHKEAPQMMAYLSGIISDLFVDRHKLRGIDVKHRLPELQGIIACYDFDQLLSVFSDKFEG